jgi:hypothetical protein
MTIRIAFGFLFILATLAVFLPMVERFFLRANAARWILGAFALSRIVGWLACYVVSPNLVRSSDLVKYYYPEAQLAMSGQLPYVDFASSYGPLFPYISGALLPIWNAPAAIALMMVICEIAAVSSLYWLVGRLRTVKENADSADPVLARTLFLYTVSPAAMYWSGMIAYNSSTVLLFWVVAVTLLLIGRYGPSIVALGVSVLIGKALGIMVAPLWVADPRRRIVTLVAAVVGAVSTLLVARHFGFDLLQPLLREGGRSTSGNLWFLLSGASEFGADSALWKFGPVLVFAAGIGALFIALLFRWRQPPTLPRLCAAIATIGWLFMLVSKKTYPHYTPMFLLFCVLALASVRPRGLWIGVMALAGAVGILEPGIWNALGQPQLLSDACRVNCDPALLFALVASDIALILCSAYLLTVCARAALEREKALTSP